LCPSGRPSRRWAAWNRSGRATNPRPASWHPAKRHHRDAVHQVGERQIGAYELVAEVVGQQLGGVLTRRGQAGEQIVQVAMVDPLKHLFGGPQRAEVPDHPDPIRWTGEVHTDVAVVATPALPAGGRHQVGEGHQPALGDRDRAAATAGGSPRKRGGGRGSRAVVMAAPFAGSGYPGQAEGGKTVVG
jgi:hypothetical protein